MESTVSGPHLPDLRPGDGVLMVRLGAVGDVIRTLPCAAALRGAFPGVRLAWLVQPGSRTLLPAAPWLDQIFEFPRGELSGRKLLSHPARSTGLLPKLIGALRSFEARMSLDFQGSLKSSLLAFSCGAPLRFGFDRHGSREGSFLMYNARVTPSSPRLNRVFKNLELLAPLGVEVATPTFPYPPLTPAPSVSRFLESLAPGVRAVVHPGTSRRQAHKRWGVDRYAIVVRQLAAEGCVPILTWGPGEEEIVSAIASLAGGAAIVAPRTTLSEMRALLMSSRIFIGGDTGPMHLAWTQGVPVVALFGSTDPRINGPLGPGHRVIAPAWTDDGPAPRRGDPQTMNRIQPEEVLAAAREILARPRAVAEASLP